MWGRIFNLVLKEFQQLRRDRQAKFRLIVPSLIQLFIFGYAATFEVYHVATAVLDLDHSQESRELISRFEDSGRFPIVLTARSPAEIHKAIDHADAIVVEVLSPSTAAIDHGRKLSGYFSLPSVQHYLILDPERRVVTHHKRGQGDTIETRVLSDGVAPLEPPGFEVAVSALFPTPAG